VLKDSQFGRKSKWIWRKGSLQEKSECLPPINQQ
jgi:hypothetical protein